jgi:hypothetical protein
MKKVTLFAFFLVPLVALAADFILGNYLSLSMADRIGIAQIIILLATAYVIFWYTLETQRIRNETSRSNAIMREQLRLMQQARSAETRKEESASDPIIVFRSAMSETDGVVFTVENQGAPMKDISISSLGSFRADIHPKQYFGAEQGTIKFTGNDLKGIDVLNIKILFTDTLGRQRDQTYQGVLSPSRLQRLRESVQIP